MVYIIVKVDKTHQMQENLKKVKIESKVYYKFCRLLFMKRLKVIIQM